LFPESNARAPPRPDREPSHQSDGEGGDADGLQEGLDGIAAAPFGKRGLDLRPIDLRRRPTAIDDQRGFVEGNLARRERRRARSSLISPQERAAAVLKDAFGLSLEEIAEALSTTTGAIKAALHRGRAKLVAPEPEEATPVAPAVLSAINKDEFGAAAPANNLCGGAANV
jgi:hypothetical protein